MARNKKQPPQGFDTWMAFWKYLKLHKPELLREKTIQFMEYNPNAEGGVSEAYSVQIDTVKRNAFMEIDEKMLGDLEMLDFIHYCYTNPNKEEASKQIEFLNTFL